MFVVLPLYFNSLRFILQTTILLPVFEKAKLADAFDLYFVHAYVHVYVCFASVSHVEMKYNRH